MNWVTSVLITCLLVTAAIIDLKKKIIPNKLVAVILLLGIAERILQYLSNGGWALIDGIIGFILGGLTFIIVALAGKSATGRDAMGGGDIKLMAAAGLFLGWQRTLVAIFLSAFIGGVVGGIGLLTRRLKRGDEIPFGPMLSAGIILAVFLGDWLIKWYLNI